MLYEDSEKFHHQSTTLTQAFVSPLRPRHANKQRLDTKQRQSWIKSTTALVTPWMSAFTRVCQVFKTHNLLQLKAIDGINNMFKNQKTQQNNSSVPRMDLAEKKNRQNTSIPWNLLGDVCRLHHWDELLDLTPPLAKNEWCKILRTKRTFTLR